MAGWNERGCSSDFAFSGARRAAFFTIYSDTGDEQIAVSLGDDVTLFYEDPDTKPASKKTISFGADISDGK